MLDRQQRLGLAVEAADEVLVVGQLGIHRLERDLALAADLLGEEHRAHAPAAQLAQQAEGGEERLVLEDLLQFLGLVAAQHLVLDQEAPGAHVVEGAARLQGLGHGVLVLVLGRPVVGQDDRPGGNQLLAEGFLAAR